MGTENRYGSYSYLDVEVQDGIAIVSFNRPETLNACSLDDHAEMAQILPDLAADDDVLVAVVTGRGKAFSVGADLSLFDDIIADPSRLIRLTEEGREITDAHIAFQKPIIAAVNGYAMGAGLAFALMCDFSIVERSVRMADGHIRAGLAAGDGGALWPMSIGLPKAKRYLLTGDWITAEEAERIGLITEVVDDGTSLERAMTYARRLAAGPQTAIRYTKQALNQWYRFGAIAAFNYSLMLEVTTFNTDEHRQAVEGLRNGTPAIPPERSPVRGAGGTP